MKSPVKNLTPLLLGLILASCASVDPHERLTSDDSLILIPTVLVNPDNSPAARVYTLKFDDGTVVRLPNDSSYGMIFTRDPGRTLLTVTSSVEGERMTGESTADKIRITFPYKPGMPVVADRMFVQTIIKNSDREYMTYWRFVSTTKEVRERVMEHFKKSRKSASWID